MKREIHILFLLSIFLSFSAFAGPVHNRILTLVQPDGTSFQARFHGDEFMRVKTDLKGHAIMQDKDGWWCYASYQPDGRKQCSGFKVGSNAPYMVISRSLDIPYTKLSQLASARRTLDFSEKPVLQQLLEQNRQMQTRSQADSPKIVKHGIVILAQFANLSFKHSRKDFMDLLTADTYAKNGASGCAKEYFEAQFDGTVDFDFFVSDIVTLSHDLAYYGANQSDSNGAESDKAPDEMIIEACRLADAQVDFSLYDDDGNGQVDNVFVFFCRWR